VDDFCHHGFPEGKDVEWPSEGEGQAKERVEKVRQGGGSRLNLSGLRLKAVPEAVREHERLEHLLLSVNELYTLSDWVARIPQLKTLDLSGNPLQELPVSLAEAMGLQSLNVSGTRLVSLPV
jgi:Leucine-rich repeat (LRR) protein